MAYSSLCSLSCDIFDSFSNVDFAVKLSVIRSFFSMSKGLRPIPKSYSLSLFSMSKFFLFRRDWIEIHYCLYEITVKFSLLCLRLPIPNISKLPLTLFQTPHFLYYKLCNLRSNKSKTLIEETIMALTVDTITLQRAQPLPTTSSGSHPRNLKLFISNFVRRER